MQEVPLIGPSIQLIYQHTPLGELHKDHKDKPYPSLCGLLEEWTPEQRFLKYLYSLYLFLVILLCLVYLVIE